MIIVSSIALATMLSNNLLIPYGFIGKTFFARKNSKRILNSRKIGIFLLIILAYAIYKIFALEYTLVSIGLVSFVIIAQLAPSFFCIILEERIKKWCCSRNHYWFSICCYTLLAPYAIGITKSTSLFIQEGPWKLHYLNHLNFSG
jgi:Na+/proline symporter